jgi:hypothetical protein
VVAIDAPEALGAIKARSTERRIAATTGVVRLVASRALTGYAFTDPGLYAMRVDRTAHTAKASGPLDTVGLSPAAASVIRWVTGDADLVDALLAAAITIGAAANTLSAIGRTKRRVAIASIMIIGIAGEADLGHALPAITVSVGLTGHTAAAISDAERRLAAAPGVVRRITGKARVTDALSGGPATIAVGLTGHAGPGGAILDAERRVYDAAGVAIARVTGEAVSGHALTDRWVITIGIIAAADALIAIRTLDTIGRRFITALIIIQVAGLTLAQRTERLGCVITLEVRRAIPADITVR